MKKTVCLGLLCCILLLMPGCTGKQESNPFDGARIQTENGTAPDFDTLQKQNPDICAWIYIPGTKINDPVYQIQEGSEKAYAENSLYTQKAYNNKDFTDLTTAVYGPLTSDGSLFGDLQKIYSEDGSLARYSPITVYTPSETILFQPFAASLFHNTHLLRTYDGLKTEESRNAFFQELSQYHVLSHQWDETVTIEKSDRLLILSTHTMQNEDLRFIILAKAVVPTV